MKPSKGFLPAAVHTSGTGIAHICLLLESCTRRHTVTRVPKQLLCIPDVRREASRVVAVQVVQLSKQLPLLPVLEACSILALLVVIANYPGRVLATSTMQPPYLVLASCQRYGPDPAPGALLQAGCPGRGGTHVSPTEPPSLLKAIRQRLPVHLCTENLCVSSQCTLLTVCQGCLVLLLLLPPARQDTGNNQLPHRTQLVTKCQHLTQMG